MMEDLQFVSTLKSYPDWEIRRDINNQIFYVDIVNKKIQKEHPRLTDKREEESNRNSRI